jgi:hypothetical protein
MTRAQSTQPPIGRTYEEALQITQATIQRRGRAYRTLVVTVVLVSAMSMGGAAVLLSWKMLAGLLAVPASCGAFLTVDNWLVSEWRRRIVTLWADDSLELKSFEEAVRSMRTLPTHTVSTMLASLPAPAAVEHVQPHGVRHALALTLRAIDVADTCQTVAISASVMLVTGAGIWAIVAHSWLPITTCVTLPAMFAANRVVGALELRRARLDGAEQLMSRVDLRAFTSAAVQIDWRTVPARQRDRFLKRVAGPAGSTR